jgi:hypothetical protein
MPIKSDRPSQCGGEKARNAQADDELSNVAPALPGGSRAGREGSVAGVSHGDHRMGG